jgi:hypothetical protein
MTKKIPVIVLLVLTIVVLVASSGCIGQGETAQNIRVTTYTQPERVYSSSPISVTVEAENIDTLPLEKLRINVFDTGRLVAKSCAELVEWNVKPREIKTLRCQLTAPSPDKLLDYQTQTTVNYEIGLIKLVTLPITAEIMSEDEYIKQQSAGTLKYTAKLFTFSDPNVRIEAELSKQPPILTRQGEKLYLYIRIRNAGSGFIEPIVKDDFSISLVNPDKNINFDPAEKCDFPKETTVLRQKDGVFPTITCEIDPAVSKNYLSRLMLIVNYKYKYNFRGSIPVTIIK